MLQGEIEDGRKMTRVSEIQQKKKAVKEEEERFAAELEQSIVSGIRHLRNLKGDLHVIALIKSEIEIR